MKGSIIPSVVEGNASQAVKAVVQYAVAAKIEDYAPSTLTRLVAIQACSQFEILSNGLTEHQTMAYGYM